MWELKNKFQDDLTIVTTGQNNNVDKYVKDFCSLFEIKYEEIIRFDNGWSSFSVYPPFRYNKLRSPRWYYINNNNFAKHCDTFIIFKEADDKSKLHVTENIKAKEKKYVIYG